SGDAIEQEGVRRAMARAESADLRVLVLDADSDWPATMQALTGPSAHWNPALDIVVVNKVDLKLVDTVGVMPLSAISGAGLPDVLERIVRSVAHLMEQGAGAPPLTRARHREALVEAEQARGRALAAPGVALVAEDLRLALR